MDPICSPWGLDLVGITYPNVHFLWFLITRARFCKSIATLPEFEPMSKLNDLCPPPYFVEYSFERESWVEYMSN
jgi:hypothetical protein